MFSVNRCMKANKALKLLKITRQTLCKYVKEGKLRVKTLPSGDYDYDDESVSEAMNGFRKRKVAVYVGNMGKEDLMRFQNEVEGFRKERLQDEVEIYHDTEKTRGSRLDCLVDEVLAFKVKEIAVLDADGEAMDSLKVLDAVARNGECRVTILNCFGDAEWRDETEESLLAFVRRVLRSTKDERFRKKLECVLRILGM